MAESEGDPPIGVFLDGLSPSERRTLAAAGFDMTRLRELAATEAGARQVRHIVNEFALAPVDEPAARRFAHADPPGLADPPGRVGAFWALYLGGSAAVLVLLGVCVVMVAQLLGLVVGIVAFTGLFLVGTTVPRSPWSRPAYLASVPAMVVLLATTLLYSPDWYLASRGRDTVATVETPSYQWEHGARVATCRVRLPDGSVHSVRGGGSCADAVGRRRPVVYDPHGLVGPAFGRRTTLGSKSRAVAAVAAGIAALAGAAGLADAARLRGARRRR
ncbi:hypothetical protein [Actinacidiphila acidipaludis]|uniref:DUF1707 domain-containing protein n=1 Tax=Actinacidiphila acidipaludis TaxID=2873382 RepID=A0ABS7QAP4_9ACTN|nr:hypothetical protein [Streptomyces acidipaludis]MBY8880191.1 hypothetical protein [Streptomyces acidipaludis]